MGRKEDSFLYEMSSDSCGKQHRGMCGTKLEMQAWESLMDVLKQKLGCD